MAVMLAITAPVAMPSGEKDGGAVPHVVVGHPSLGVGGTGRHDYYDSHKVGAAIPC
jgi:hypothetical protein